MTNFENVNHNNVFFGLTFLSIELTFSGVHFRELSRESSISVLVESFLANMLVKYLLNNSALATSSVSTQPFNFTLGGMDGVFLTHFKHFWISLNFRLFKTLLSNSVRSLLNSVRICFSNFLIFNAF